MINVGPHANLRVTPQPTDEELVAIVMAIQELAQTQDREDQAHVAGPTRWARAGRLDAMRRNGTESQVRGERE